MDYNANSFDNGEKQDGGEGLLVGEDAVCEQIVTEMEF